MTSILDLRVPADQFALADTLGTISDLEIEIERLVAHEQESLMPLAWVTTEDFEEFEAKIDDDPSVETFSRLTELGEECLYRMNWVDAVDLVVHLLLEEDGVVLRARAEGTEWYLQVMCPQREALSRTYEFCEANGLTITVDSVYDLDGRPGERLGLTDDQQTTLRAAFEEGYYDVPRTVTLTELSEALDISHQALSERLRRGHANLVETTLTPEKDEPEGKPSVLDR